MLSLQDIGFATTYHIVSALDKMTSNQTEGMIVIVFFTPSVSPGRQCLHAARIGCSSSKDDICARPECCHEPKLANISVGDDWLKLPFVKPFSRRQVCDGPSDLGVLD